MNLTSATVEARTPDAGLDKIHGDALLVSIVINNYNYGRYIAQAVDSALAQTYPNVEVVVVDDGSTDDSLRVLASYKSRVRLLTKQNGGQASAFNVGIGAARGQFILILDSDDYLFPNAVEECLASLPQGYSRVYFKYQPVDANGSQINDVAATRFYRQFDGDFVRDVAQSGEVNCPPTSTNFFRADALRASLPIPEEDFRMCADTFVVLRSALHGRVKSLDVELGAYRFHGANGFVTAGAIAYSDLRRVRSRLDHVARVHRLLRSTCELAGVPFRAPRAEADYGWVKALCVAYRFKLFDTFAGSQTRTSLAKIFFRHFRLDSSSAPTRVGRLLYLLLLLFSPLAATRRLLLLRDQTAT
jgi:glycosyltransferase involved in cell wall biosynthesis